MKFSKICQNYENCKKSAKNAIFIKNTNFEKIYLFIYLFSDLENDMSFWKKMTKTTCRLDETRAAPYGKK